ncbi:hypothetical protein EMIHUDRAFT_237827 [Emiliania huxleyi CCMP1516]|uniref:SAP domain-containing protein n=2 Tax=Emiliania huxleyi TaxID=2903 RepID=A0A0D3JPF7_EMIH1|nr:hypothetical protein EMIHUDRAFT_237827 [Emiliania huxleyi CCMP1516]EOD25392.1 hypothetical protein EMIHUDRAFT_237827 [Emiliania huxleyi CCMP1516]|eukprot:XP_005777821.1 hypothetical protein EMIHUDRAFT_237827 [Emiliania huxleyi CCMP1516]
MLASLRRLGACQIRATKLATPPCGAHSTWQLWLAERGLAPPLSAPFSDRCRNAFVSGGVHVSKLQREVVSSLSRLGFSAEEEVLTEAGYSLDAVIEHGGARIAVEVDGPSHFIGQEPSGATLLKRRQLRSFGWPLLSLKERLREKGLRVSGRKAELIDRLLVCSARDCSSC